jgi:hypothetical protein
MHGTENVKLMRIVNDKSVNFWEETVNTLEALSLYLRVGSEEKRVIIIIIIIIITLKIKTIH